jgi:hypothetical protein
VIVVLPQEAAHLDFQVAGKHLDAIQKSFLLVVESPQLFPIMGRVKVDLRRQVVQLLVR